jgi:hypothetical protein
MPRIQICCITPVWLGVVIKNHNSTFFSLNEEEKQTKSQIAKLISVFFSSSMFTICTLSSDVLAYVCSFVASDRNVVDLFICCKRIQSSQFLTKTDLKQIYQYVSYSQYTTLFELRNRIRHWKLFKVTDSTPPCLYELWFSREFDESINNIAFPITLKRLIFGACFNKNIDNTQLPLYVEQLTFGRMFNQNINNV